MLRLERPKRLGDNRDPFEVLRMDIPPRHATKPWSWEATRSLFRAFSKLLKAIAEAKPHAQRI